MYTRGLSLQQAQQEPMLELCYNLISLLCTLVMAVTSKLVLLAESLGIHFPVRPTNRPPGPEQRSPPHYL